MAASTFSEMFNDRLDDIQNQINQIKEQASSTLSPSTTAQANTRIIIITHHCPTREEENKPTSNARSIPDSEGFWRDIDGDVWVRDTAGTMQLITKGHNDGTQEIYDLSSNFSSNYCMQEFGPYTKIDNPFIQSENHAE